MATPSKKKSSKKTVAKPKTTAIGDVIDFAADSGKGAEQADSDSYAIPFLRVLQPQSPQVVKAKSEYVDGAEPGMLFNSVTEEFFDGDKGVELYICYFQRQFIRWGSRNSDGGFKGAFTASEAAKQELEGVVVRDGSRLYYPLEDGSISEKKSDKLSDTRNHYCIIENGDKLSRVLLSLSSTQIKQSKRIMAELGEIQVDTPQGKVNPPLFAVRLRVTTAAESNDEGDWFGIRFDVIGFVDNNETYKAAKSFYEQVKQGDVAVDYNQAEEPEKSGF